MVVITVATEVEGGLLLFLVVDIDKVEEAIDRAILRAAGGISYQMSVLIRNER